MATQTVSRTFKTADAQEGWTRRNAVTRDGVLALRRGHTLADESGRCNSRDVERIAGLRQARKTFVLDAVAARRALLCPYLHCEGAEGELEIAVNGHATVLRARPQRPYWEDAWTPIEIPPAQLRPGRNEVVFRSLGESTWNLLLECSRWPDRSEVSDDGGRTWRAEELGVNDRADGEYAVRLWLDQHLPAGEVASGSIDLLDLAGAGVAATGTPRRARVRLEGEVPERTRRQLEWRAGDTPVYGPESWSAWQPLAPEGAALPPGARFFQWRALLSTDDPAMTPAIAAAHLEVEVEDLKPGASKVVEADNRPLVRSSYRFAHQRAGDHRARILRERWKLDQVVGPAKTEFEALVRLRQWTRQQWEDGWNTGPLSYCPPWDALVILELAGQQLSLGMCTHYATVMTQCCAALGFTARTQVMRAHCITEVWSNDYGKWVTMDPGGDNNDATKFTYHFERDGIPLSALEAHRAWVTRDLDGIVLSPPPPPEAASRFTVEGRIQLWERFMLSLRNDETATLEPGEPEHGAGSYHYDGYLFWQDELTEPLPWFTRHTDRVGDLYWDVDRVRIHLQAGAERSALRVQLEHTAPNFARFEVRLDGGAWEERPAAFDWTLRQCESRLEARSVNAHGRAGAVSSVTALV